MKYATIKRGKVKLDTGSKQFRYLMWKHLPVSVVTISRKGKRVRRLNL